MAAALALASLTAHSLENAEQALPLYPGAIPGAIEAPDQEALRDPREAYPFLLNISRPTLTPYLPQQRDVKRAAVIILPGGSYRGLSIVKEGSEVAKAFNAMGVAAFVLKYRTPDPMHMQDRTLGPLQDVQQAVRIVRARAADWNIDASRIGVLGFSAGGHLAATVATHVDPVLPAWQGVNLRPDFLMLIYPVISFSDPLAHAYSRRMLLGDSPTPDTIRRYSNELQVTDATPRTFIVHAADDATVPVGNSIRFFEALQAHKVPVELIVYPAGGHGYGLHNATTTDRWIDRARQWLMSQGLLGSDE
ncbi:alpha/beta hydrolase [Povalibacter sp.]|uniref:alpha/beta hydrolase n=1 Tax=Povalibacter sp. TaxID=1962978 RepID=UPI002F3F0200